MAFDIGPHVQIKSLEFEQLKIIRLTDFIGISIYKDNPPSPSGQPISDVYMRIFIINEVTNISLFSQFNLSVDFSIQCRNFAACRLSNNKFIVAFFGTENGNSAHAHFGVIEINGSFITTGDLSSDLSANSLGIPRLEQLETDKFILAYTEQISEEILPFLRVGSVNGTTVSLGDEKSVVNESSDSMDISVLSPTNVAVIFRKSSMSDRNTFCNAATISGNVISIGVNQIVIPPDVGIENAAIGKLDDTHVSVFYGDNNNSNLGTSKVVTITGTDVNVHNAEVFDFGMIENPVGASDPQNSFMLSAYLSASNQGIIRSASRWVNNIVWDEKVILHSGGTSYLAISHMTDTISVAMYTDTLDGDVKMAAFSFIPTMSLASFNIFIKSGISGTSARPLDWLLKMPDYFPQIIGTFATPASSVNIQIWDVTNGDNTLVAITNSGCYSIGDTGRWGWSTENIPISQGYGKHYFYIMTSDISEIFDGQFIIDVPEDAKWIHPNDNVDYIRSI